jgi:uncharacterized membrane protein YhiD involved in acid resistance
MTNVKRIESYGLYDFCQDVQEAFKEGYVFDFDTNENFPTAYGTMLTCGLVKASKKVEEKVEETAETEQSSETVSQTEQTEEVVQNTEQSTEEATEVVTEETTEVETNETPEVKEPAKRGPKPKNK